VKLYNQKEILDLLKKDKIASLNAASFSEAVSRGRIPFRTKPNSKRKWYCYEDVKKAMIKGNVANASLSSLKAPSNSETPIEYGAIAVKQLGSEPTLADVNIFKAIYTGKLEQLKYERESEQLIRKENVENTAFIVARTIRDKLMAIPERLSDELASISDSYVIKEMLYKELNKLLEGFSEDSFI